MAARIFNQSAAGIVLAALTACSSSGADQPRAHESTSPSTPRAVPGFQTLWVRVHPPTAPSENLRRYGVDVLAGNRITYQFLGSSTCLAHEGPTAMLNASPTRVTFRIVPRGCTDDLRILTALVEVNGVTIDRSRNFVLKLLTPRQPPGTRTLVLPPQA
jgi:hypothetical protein